MSIKRNIVANYLGQGWAALMGLAFIPLYIARLGIEAYAMVGVFTLLLAWMGIADFGLTPTVNREMARAKVGAHSAQSINDLLRTFEVACTTIAMIFSLMICVLVPYIVSNWLKPDQLKGSQLVDALYIMAFAVACRWLEQFYRAILLGLQDSVWLNYAWAILSTLRWGGAYMAISLGPSTLGVFFSAQALAAVIGMAILGRRAYQLLPESPKKRNFNWKSILEVKRFASGMFLGSILAFLLTNTDKIVVSKMLALKQFGYYTLATTLAASLLQIVVPMNNVMYPKYTELVAKGDFKTLRDLYIKSCELLSALLIPPGLVLVFLSKPVLLAWTNDVTLATEVAPLLSLLALGTLCNGLMNLPYMLQLAHGWVRLSISINVIAVIIVLPILLFATPRYGAVGAAFCWFLVNMCYVIVTAHFMHRKVLVGMKWPWYKRAITRPLVFGSVTMALGWLAQNYVTTQVGSTLLILSSCLLCWFVMFVLFKKSIFSQSL